MTIDSSQIIHNFLNLEKESRAAQDLRELSFIACNLTKKIVPFNQAILWRNTKTGIHIYSISAIANINRKSPYIHWLESKLLPWLNKQKPQYIYRVKDAPEYLRKEWVDSVAGNVISYPFNSIDDKRALAGIVFIVSAPWLDNQKTVAEELFHHYQHCWQRLEQKEKKTRINKLWFNRKKTQIKLALAFSILLIFFIPVEQTIITQAEVSPRDPILITSSIEGIINQIYVKPNQKVTKGQILFSLDKITLKNNVKQARKEASVAREKFRQAYQHAYNNPDSKSELAVLKSEVEKADNELEYRKRVLNRGDIRALQSGIIIFSAPKYWLGKPIKIGEQVMLLANVGQKQLDSDIPQNDMITINKGNKVKFYPNIDPLNPLDATVTYASYVANSTKDGELTYYVACEFKNLW